MALRDIHRCRCCNFDRWNLVNNSTDRCPAYWHRFRKHHKLLVLPHIRWCQCSLVHGNRNHIRKWNLLLSQVLDDKLNWWDKDCSNMHSFHRYKLLSDIQIQFHTVYPHNHQDRYIHRCLDGKFHHYSNDIRFDRRSEVQSVSHIDFL